MASSQVTLVTGRSGSASSLSRTFRPWPRARPAPWP